MIRTLVAADIPYAARVLARAFCDDPVFAWLWRVESKRPAQLERGFTLLMTRLYVRQGECLIAADGSGAALWVSPGRWHATPRQQLGLLPLLSANSGRAWVRSLRTLARMESVHPRSQHFFLPFVGVEPARQGRGVGSALLRPVLERCDRDGVPAYLEASSSRNRALYERHGFATLGELPLLRGCPPMWMMWREPGGGAPRAAARRDAVATS